MFSPADLDKIPDEIDNLFKELDEYIIRDFARRLKKAGEITDTAEWLLEASSEIGLSEEIVKEAAKKIIEMSVTELENSFSKLAEKSIDEDVKRFKSAGLNVQRIMKNSFLEKYIKAAIKQTEGELRNITRTMGFAIGPDFYNLTDYYRNRLDFIQLQVSSGVSDYTSAIRREIGKVAKAGVQTITYESGYHLNIASAARMCTLTGANQMARQINDAVCDELDLDLVEVTAHAGARPTHQTWQGKIYSRSGRSKKYPALIPSTGLGTVEGLCGARCRHNYYGYFEGSPRAYSDSDLQHIDPAPFDYNGKTYTYYEATQKMRSLERNMRKAKRQAVAADEAGLEDDFRNSTIRLNRIKDEYDRFAKVSGVRKRKDLQQEFGYGRSRAQRGRRRRR